MTWISFPRMENALRLLGESFELVDADMGAGGDAGPAPAVAVAPARWENVHIFCDAKEEMPDEEDEFDDWCFMCEIGAFDQTNPWCAQISAYIAKHGMDMRNCSLARDVQKMYVDNIMPYMDVPRRWTLSCIIRHVQNHTINRTLMLRHTIRVLSKTLEVMERGSLRSRRMDRPAPDEIDTRMLKAYRETVDTRSRLMRELEHTK